MGTKQPNTKLRAIREARSLSQVEVAKKVGVPTNTYQRWEAEGVMPQPEYRRKLCKDLEASLEELGLIPGKNDTPSGTIIALKDTSEYRKEQNEYLQSDLGLRLLSIVGAGTYDDQRKEFEQIMEQFDALSTENLDYEMTRRQAIISLATFPFTLPINLEKRERVSSSHYELFLQECGASLAACEKLADSSDPRDLWLAFRCVCRYLVELQIVSSSFSRYRAQALELAAHCALLKRNLGWHCVGNTAALTFVQDALVIARELGDVCLQLSAYSKRAWGYLYSGERELALATAREARDLLETHKGQLPICIRGGTWSTLSVMQARNGRSPDTARKKALEQGADSELRYGMLFTDIYAQIEQARALYYFGETSEAMAIYTQIVDPNTLVATYPYKDKFDENLRIEIILDMSRASMKGAGRDMKNAIEYWEAAIEGAKQMKNEGVYGEALNVHDAMDYAFPGEKQIHDLCDHFRHGKGWK